MKSWDPKEILQKEYDDRQSYSFWVTAAIVQGEHDIAFQFLEKNTDKRGRYNLFNVRKNILKFPHSHCIFFLPKVGLYG